MSSMTVSSVATVAVVGTTALREKGLCSAAAKSLTAGNDDDGEATSQQVSLPRSLARDDLRGGVQDDDDEDGGEDVLPVGEQTKGRESVSNAFDDDDDGAIRSWKRAREKNVRDDVPDGGGGDVPLHDAVGKGRDELTVS